MKDKSQDRADVAEMRRLAHQRMDGLLTQKELDEALDRIMSRQQELNLPDVDIKRLAEGI